MLVLLAVTLAALFSVPCFGQSASSRFVITAVDNENREFAASELSHLPYSQRSVGFRLDADPSPGERAPRFRYRLRPIIAAWTETEQESIWFPSLPSGKYTFEVQRSGGSAAQWERSKSIAFEVLSPWWLHPYFLLVPFALALLLIREFFRVRVIHLLKRQHELESAVQTRTKELEAERSELIAAREALLARAMRDGLTGLWNRSSIFDILDRELDRAKRGDRPVAVILADLDHFKQINDTHGHQTGDAVLVESALRLTADLRAYDSTGRYGGEELLIVLSNCDREAAMARAEDLRLRLRSRPIQSQDHEIWITSSFGIAISNPHSTSRELVHDADQALYRAKRMGRDCAVAAWTLTEDPNVEVSSETTPAPVHTEV